MLISLIPVRHLSPPPLFLLPLLHLHTFFRFHFYHNHHLYPLSLLLNLPLEILCRRLFNGLHQRDDAGGFQHTQERHSAPLSHLPQLLVGHQWTWRWDATGKNLDTFSVILRTVECFFFIVKELDLVLFI